MSKTSLKRLETCHPLLQEIAKKTLTFSRVDFGIIEGQRSLERQKKLFDEKRSRIDGISKKGKHNYTPSLAFDFYAFYDGLGRFGNDTVEMYHLAYLAGQFMVIGEGILRMDRESEMPKYSDVLRLRWGGNWNEDGIIVAGQKLVDMPHLELVVRDKSKYE